VENGCSTKKKFDRLNKLKEAGVAITPKKNFDKTIAHLILRVQNAPYKATGLGLSPAKLLQLSLHLKTRLPMTIIPRQYM